MFHAHGARALDQDPVGRPEYLEQGLLDVGPCADDDVGGGHAAAAGAGGGLGGQVTAGEEPADTRAGRAPADLPVHAAGLAPEFAHVAGHQDAPAAAPQRVEHREGRFHGGRVGVVRVVDQGDSVG